MHVIRELKNVMIGGDLDYEYDFVLRHKKFDGSLFITQKCSKLYNHHAGFITLELDKRFLIGNFIKPTIMIFD